MKPEKLLPGLGPDADGGDVPVRIAQVEVSVFGRLVPQWGPGIDQPAQPRIEPAVESSGQGELF